MKPTLRKALLFALVLPSIALGRPPQGDACTPAEKFAPGVVSVDGQWEWRLSFTPQRDRIYWASTAGWWPGTREKATILTSEWRRGSGWSMPVAAGFSGVHSDFDPFVSPDGRTLFFSSMRPVEGRAKTDMDLWMVQRTARGWGEPVHLREASLDGYDELYASADVRGNLYFARVKAPVPEGDVDIWRSRRGPDGRYGPAEKLGPHVNTPERWEFNPEISPDGRTLLFTRLDLPDALPDAGYGWGDLHISRFKHRDFGPARNLGPCVNSAYDEFHPTMLWERGVLFFARTVGDSSDFYRVPLKSAP